MGWAYVVMGLEGSSQESGIAVVGTGEGGGGVSLEEGQQF